MKIIHLISGLGVGGAEMMLYKLVASEPDDAVEHVVISMLDTGPVGAMLEQAGVPVYALNMARGRASAGALGRLVRLLREIRPDVMQTWMYHANLLGLIGNTLAGRVPLVWGLRHASLDPTTNKASTLRIVRLSAPLSRFTAAVVCCSEKTKEVHAAVGYAAEKLHMIPNGFDTEVFQPDRAAGQAVRASLGLDGRARVIGMVGRYDPLKDHANFLRAAARVHATRPEVRFLLCGSDVTEQNALLVEEIRSLGLGGAVHLLGRRTDVSAVMNALDVHVLSSSGEGFPNVLGEAMACGVPCITTDVGDAALIVGPTGWVVPPQDSAALGAAMLDVLSLGNDEMQARRKQARARVRACFGLDTVRGRYHDLYRELA